MTFASGDNVICIDDTAQPIQPRLRSGDFICRSASLVDGAYSYDIAVTPETDLPKHVGTWLRIGERYTVRRAAGDQVWLRGVRIPLDSAPSFAAARFRRSRLADQLRFGLLHMLYELECVWPNFAVTHKKAPITGNMARMVRAMRPIIYCWLALRIAIVVLTWVAVP